MNKNGQVRHIFILVYWLFQLYFLSYHKYTSTFIWLGHREGEDKPDCQNTIKN